MARNTCQTLKKLTMTTFNNMTGFSWTSQNGPPTVNGLEGSVYATTITDYNSCIVSDFVPLVNRNQLSVPTGVINNN